MENPGEVIKTLREEKKMSRRTLSRLSGASARAIVYYEHGKRMPRTDTYADILAVFGYDIKIVKL